MKGYLISIFLSIPILAIMALIFLIPYYPYSLLQKDDGFVINDYAVTMNVNEDNSIDVQERITAYFSASSRGLVRNIPLKGYVTTIDDNGNAVNNIYDYQISNVKVQENDQVGLVGSETDGGYLVLYIGQNSYNSDFSQTYSLSYTISLGDDRDQSTDSFYYNVLGPGWTTDIEHFSYQVTFPDKVDLTGQEYFVYVGAYGEDTTGTTLTFDGNTISGQYSDLEYGTAVTVQTFFEDGYFNVPYSYTTDIIFLAIALIILALLGIALWIYRKKNRVIEVVEFSAPNGITPTEAGFLIDGKVQSKDLTALIVYWASKKYIKIEESEKEVNRDEIVKLTKLQDLPEDATAHEKKFFSGIFDKDRKEVYVSNLGRETAVAGNSAKTQVESRFKQFFVDNISKLMWLVLVIYAALIAFSIKLGMQDNSELNMLLRFLFAFVMFLSVWPISRLAKNKDNMSGSKKAIASILFIVLYVGGFIGYNFFFLYAPFDPLGVRFILSISLLILCMGFLTLERYTAEGAKLVGRVRGLKKYILLTEKRKMEMQVEENPSLFYDVLPYAYALGVSDVYMEKFEDIKVTIENNSGIGINLAGLVIATHMLNVRFTAIGAIATKSMLSTIVGAAVKYGGSFGGGFGRGGGRGGSGGGHGGGGGGRF